MASVAPISSPPSKILPKILIVEDEPAQRFLVATVLEDDGGFDLLVAGSADEALKVIAQHEGIDCVFTDVNMPGRLDGLDLAKGVLADHPKIKVVITSANTYPGPPLEGVPFLAKPYDLTSLPQCLRGVLSSRGA